MRSERAKIFVGRYRNILVAYGVMLVVLVLFANNQADFFTRYGPQSIFNQIITLCIATLGQTLIILTSGIDLSIGNQIIFLNCVMATVMQPIIDAVGSEPLGIALTLVVIIASGAVCGLLNGVLITYGRLQPIVVTLATSSVYIGMARYVRPSPGGDVNSDFAKFMTGRVFEFIPVSALVLLVVIVLIWLPFRNSKSGQALYAIGGNETAAYLSGININRAKVSAYLLAGVCSALCAIMLTAQTRSGDPTAANNFTNNSIAAAALGGAALSGGTGSYFGSIAGAVILSLIVGLLVFWKVSSYYQNLIQGLILVLALSVNWIVHMVKKRRTAACAAAK